MLGRCISRDTRQMARSFPLNFRLPAKKAQAFAGLALVALGLAACAAPPPPATPYDPFERTNRGVHAFNLALDRNLIRPASKGYGFLLPAPVRQGVSNVASNLDLPADMANGALQGNPKRVVQNGFRFLINSTIGVLGLFDPATPIGLPQDKTDFGETLHVWGVGEGPYVELPAFGPSTARDAVGTAVDFALNPASVALQPPESTYATGFKLASKLGDRDRYSATVDSILYDSADSYAQARLLYLQNRHFELGQVAEGASGGDDFIDPYEE